MITSTTALRGRDWISPTIAALISVIVNYGCTFILVFQAAKVARLSPEMTASWIWSISIGVGITGIWLSYRYREPIITAWSTPGVAFLVSALAVTPYPEAIGAYMISAAGFIVLGLSGMFERFVQLIPPGITSGLLAGILLQFGISTFGGAKRDRSVLFASDGKSRFQQCSIGDCITGICRSRVLVTGFIRRCLAAIYDYVNGTVYAWHARIAQ